MKKKLIRANDNLARQINRLKGNCERCGRDGERWQMHWCHVIGRRAKSLRWNPLNHLLLCATDHRWQHESPLAFTEWFIDTFGEDRAKTLQEMEAQVKPMTLKDYERINKELKSVLESLLDKT